VLHPLHFQKEVAFDGPAFDGVDVGADERTLDGGLEKEGGRERGREGGREEWVSLCSFDGPAFDGVDVGPDKGTLEDGLDWE
jgi:hypothetical protein